MGNGQHPVNGNGRGKTPAKFYCTIDYDWVTGSHSGLELLLRLCDRYQLKGTIFFARRFAEAYSHLVRDCHDRGHQLSTHGWAHGGLEEDEDFRRPATSNSRNGSAVQLRPWNKPLESVLSFFGRPIFQSAKPPSAPSNMKAIGTIPPFRPDDSIWDLGESTT